jgi:hypothetical protein
VSLPAAFPPNQFLEAILSNADGQHPLARPLESAAMAIEGVS